LVLPITQSKIQNPKSKIQNLKLSLRSWGVMSHEIQQWIVEIRSLQQQLADMQRDRDQANDSAANWCQLYNKEAQQRRDDAKLAQETVAALRAEIEQLQQANALTLTGEADAAAIAATVEQWQTVAELKAKLIEVMLECDRLSNNLKIEQEAHATTRYKLTTALGDAVDVVAILKGRNINIIPTQTYQETAPAAAQLPGTAQGLPSLPSSAQPLAQLPAATKTPLLKLPPTRPAPPRS
jgi:chromosome segregation ATPase